MGWVLHRGVGGSGRRSSTKRRQLVLVGGGGKAARARRRGGHRVNTRKNVSKKYEKNIKRGAFSTQFKKKLTYKSIYPMILFI